MRIYDKLVIDMATSEVIEDECITRDYEGPIMHCSSNDNDIEETPEQRAVASRAVEEWNRAQTMMAPAENKYMDELRVTEGDEQYLTGQAAGSVQGALGQADRQTRAGLQQQGALPGSGRWQATMTDQDIGRGEALSRATTGAGEDAVDLHYQGLQHIVDLGRGQANESNLALGQLAEQSSRTAVREALNEQQERANRSYAIGSVAGMGARKGKGYLDSQPSAAESMVNASYNTQNPSANAL